MEKSLLISWIIIFEFGLFHTNVHAQHAEFVDQLCFDAKNVLECKISEGTNGNRYTCVILFGEGKEESFSLLNLNNLGIFLVHFERAVREGYKNHLSEPESKALSKPWIDLEGSNFFNRAQRHFRSELPDSDLRSGYLSIRNFISLGARRPYVHEPLYGLVQKSALEYIDADVRSLDISQRLSLILEYNAHVQAIQDYFGRKDVQAEFGKICDSSNCFNIQLAADTFYFKAKNWIAESLKQQIFEVQCDSNKVISGNSNEVIQNVMSHYNDTLAQPGQGSSIKDLRRALEDSLNKRSEYMQIQHAIVENLSALNNSLISSQESSLSNEEFSNRLRDFMNFNSMIRSLDKEVDTMRGKIQFIEAHRSDSLKRLLKAEELIDKAYFKRSNKTVDFVKHYSCREDYIFPRWAGYDFNYCSRQSELSKCLLDLMEEAHPVLEFIQSSNLASYIRKLSEGLEFGIDVDSCKIKFEDGNIEQLVLQGRLVRKMAGAFAKHNQIDARPLVFMLPNEVGFSSVYSQMKIHKEYLVEVNHGRLSIPLELVFDHLPELHNYSEDYSPADGTYGWLKPGDQRVILMEEDVDRMLDARIYTDVVGLASDAPNGQIQAEFTKMISLWSDKFTLSSTDQNLLSRYSKKLARLDALREQAGRRRCGCDGLERDMHRIQRRLTVRHGRTAVNYSTVRMGFGQYLQPTLRVAKIEGHNRHYVLQPGLLAAQHDGGLITQSVKFIPTIEAWRHAQATLSANLNAITFDFPVVKTSVEFNAGIQTGVVAVADSLTTNDSGVETANGPGRVLMHGSSVGVRFVIRPDAKYGLALGCQRDVLVLRSDFMRNSNPEIIQANFIQHSGDPEGESVANRFRLLNSIQLDAYAKTGKRSKVFFRGMYMWTHKAADYNHLQLQVGYSYEVLKK